MAQAPGEGMQLHLLQRAEPFAESTNNFRDKTRRCIAINTHWASRAAQPPSRAAHALGGLQPRTWHRISSPLTPSKQVERYLP